jgi:lipoprotein-releasing system permease protein
MSLIIVVAAFNIISGLTIFVKNKTREIAILKSIGVSSYTIKKIFFLIGFFIGTFATFFGIILGVLFSIYIEKIRSLLSTLFNLNLFPEEIYFLSKMPSEINIESVILVSLCSIFVTCVVSVYPASKASQLNPARGLKYD